MRHTLPLLARRSVVSAAAAALMLLVAAPALTAPANPRSPADEALLDTRRPVFAWTPGTPTSPAPLVRYEVLIEAPGGDRRVAEAPAGSLSAPAIVDLPDDARTRWYVRTIDAAGRVQLSRARYDVRISTRPVAPAIVEGPGEATNAPSPTFAWAGDRRDSRWALLDAAGAIVRSGAQPRATGRADLDGLPEGDYVFRVVQRNAVGVEGDPATRAFSVDRSAPGALTVAPAQRTTSPDPSPAFAMGGMEPGAVVRWRVLGRGGAVVQGPLDTRGPTVTPGPLSPGSYLLEARQADRAGNLGPLALEPFAVLPASAGASEPSVASASRRRLPRLNAARLRPRAGVRIAVRRPVLRWPRGPRGTRLYNVQVYRVVKPSGRLRKIHSAFPRRTRYRIPPRARLARGACYVWRVWPYLGTRFTERELGVSHFCVRSSPRAPARARAR